MQTHSVGIFVIGVLSLTTACASHLQPPALRAAGVERLQCDGSATGQDEIQLLQSAKVLRVDPLYSHVLSSNNNSEERVNGAKLLIRPPKGMSAEQLTRVLQCHSARVLLGQVSGAAVPNDPYWLADAWVNIDVKPEDGNFAVTLSAESIHDNIQVLHRASHYADEHMLATEPELP
jgi:hypothetical protein